MIMSVKDIVSYIAQRAKVEVVGSLRVNLTRIHSLDDAEGGGLSFCTADYPDLIPLIHDTKAKAIICKYNDAFPEELDRILITVDNPRLWFIRVAKKFFPPDPQPDIHPTAIINHPYVVLGKNVKIGPGCTIGFDGFGYEKNEKGRYESFPHYGRVVIGDDVEIKSNVNIDRGTLGDTVIGRGTKIDSLTHIAHNAQIGENCIIVCLTCIAGGAKIRDGVWVAPLVGVLEGREVGENAVVGMGAIVIRDVEPGDVVAGVPAKSIKKAKG